MAGTPFRILALVGDAFGGYGGIAQYNRDFISSLARCDGVGEIVVLPRLAPNPLGPLPAGVRQLGPVANKFAYSFVALRTARMQGPFNLVFCGHLFMAPLAALVASLMKAPLWIQIHGREAWRETSALQRRSVESARLVTCVSRYSRRRLLEWMGIEPARVKVLPNTVDPRYSPGQKPEYLVKRHAVEEKKVILTVARLVGSERHKGHDRVIKALPSVLFRHPKTIYLIVGGGDDRPRLEELARVCGVEQQVQFAGLVPVDELPDYFRLADVFVMPSAADGFGIVFLEALATGIRVIGGSRDGSRDALCDGALGTLVDPENNDELAVAMEAALDDPARTVDRTDRFKPERFVSHLDALYQFCVSG